MELAEDTFFVAALAVERRAVGLVWRMVVEDMMVVCSASVWFVAYLGGGRDLVRCGQVPLQLAPAVFVVQGGEVGVHGDKTAVSVGWDVNMVVVVVECGVVLVLGSLAEIVELMARMERVELKELNSCKAKVDVYPVWL